MKKTVIILFLLISLGIFAQNPNSQDEIKLEQAREFYDKGIYFGQSGKLDSALIYSKKAVNILENVKSCDSIFLANAYQSLGIINKLLGKLDNAIAYYDKSEEIYRQKNENLLLTFMNINKASIFRTQQNYAKAKDYINQSILILKSDSIKYKNQLASAYNNLGNVYHKTRDYNKAISSYKKSLLLKGENTSIYRTLGNMALCYKNLSNPKLAEFYHMQAIKTAIIHYGDSNNVNIARHYLNYANFLGAQDEFSQSLNYFVKTYNIYIENYGNKHPDLSLCYNDLGSLYLKMNQLDSALLYFQRSLIAISPDFSDTSLVSNPEIDGVLSKTHFLSSLKNKAKALSFKANECENPDYYTASLQTYDIAIETINKIRSGYISEESKLFLAENEFETFSQALEVSYKLFHLTQDKYYINKAFYYSEAGKSAILTEAIKNTQALNIGGIPDSLLNKEKQLEKGIWNYEELIYEENKKKNPDKNKLEYWNKYLFELKQEYDNLMSYFEDNFQKYHQLKHHENSLSIQDIQQKISRHDIILEYFYSDSSIFSILISKNSSDLIEFNITPEFRYYLDTLLASLSNNNFSNHGFDEFELYQESSYYIYSQLLKPIEEMIKGKNLIIIPDGKLAYLPFEALTTENLSFDRINYKELSYLVYNQDVSYSYSASLMYQNGTYNKKASRNLGAFAPTYNNLSSLPDEFASFRQEYREKLFPLKGIKVEVQEISDLLNGDEYLDYEANEGKFKEVAHLYDILHLAMHTILDDKNPMYSKMAFTQQDDSIEDGFLNTYELYNMKLNSRMAVLSSCNSGSGKLQRGEGVMSLARGFIYSGCPSIIMTLWSVEDKSGVKLMTSFYKYLLKGKSKSEAIQLSKIDFIAGADQLKAHPYFWSGYVVIGNNSPLFISKVKIAIILSIVIISALIIFWVFRVRRKKVN